GQLQVVLRLLGKFIRAKILRRTVRQQTLDVVHVHARLANHAPVRGQLQHPAFLPQLERQRPSRLEFVEPRLSLTEARASAVPRRDGSLRVTHARVSRCGEPCCSPATRRARKASNRLVFSSSFGNRYLRSICTTCSSSSAASLNWPSSS